MSEPVDKLWIERQGAWEGKLEEPSLVEVIDYLEATMNIVVWCVAIFGGVATLALIITLTG